MSAIFVTIFKIKEIFLTTDQRQQKHMSARKGLKMYLFKTRHPETDFSIGFVVFLSTILISTTNRVVMEQSKKHKDNLRANWTKTLPV